MATRYETEVRWQVWASQELRFFFQGLNQILLNINSYIEHVPLEPRDETTRGALFQSFSPSATCHKVKLSPYETNPYLTEHWHASCPGSRSRRARAGCLCSSRSLWSLSAADQQTSHPRWRWTAMFLSAWCCRPSCSQCALHRTCSGWWSWWSCAGVAAAHKKISAWNMAAAKTPSLRETDRTSASGTPKSL